MEDYRSLLPRHLLPRVREMLGCFPVVAILGARQVGKSTLVKMLVDSGWPGRILTLDDFDLLAAARRNPDDFVDGLRTPVVIDEVQRVPDLLRSVKRVVDRVQEPGLFLLTGSANLLTMRGLSESLAGRVCLLELLPFSQAELSRTREASPAVDLLFEVQDAADLVAAFEGAPPASPGEDTLRSLLVGGYPPATRARTAGHRAHWFDSYRRTYLERDLRDVARIQDLVSFGQLLTSVAASTGEMVNATRLSRDLGLSLNTTRRYLDLLETTYQIFRVWPYSVNVRRRVVKTPKLYLTDTGLASHLVGARDMDVLELQGRTGAFLETWVANELRKILSVGSPSTELYFWRTHTGHEVDFLLGRGTKLAGIEVKRARTIRSEDLRGLRQARDVLGTRMGVSVLLHGGTRAFAPETGIAVLPLGSFLAGR